MLVKRFLSAKNCRGQLSYLKKNHRKLHKPKGHFGLSCTFCKDKQAGNGPIRRHILGSKIAKGLQGVKYSLLLYPREQKLKKNPIFYKYFVEFFWSPVSRIVPKNVKEGPLGICEHPFFCKIDIKKIGEKKSQSRKKPALKIFGQGRDSNPRPSAWQTFKKAVRSMLSASRSSVAQFSVSASQLIKFIKSVSSLVLKKEEKMSLL